jgi:bifunctional DNase/RNase
MESMTQNADAQRLSESEAVLIEQVALATEEKGHKIILKPGGDGQGQVEMYIGGSEFASIAKELGLVEPPRPLTHDIYLTLLEGLEIGFHRLEIYDLKENAFLARLFYTKKGQEMVAEIRPSDGVALALNRRIPILLNKRLLRGILSPQDREALSELVKTVKF